MCITTIHKYQNINNKHVNVQDTLMTVANLCTQINSDYFLTYSTGFGRFALTKDDQSDNQFLEIFVPTRQANEDYRENLSQVQ